MIQHTLIEEKIGKALLIDRQFLTLKEWDQCLKLVDICRSQHIHLPLHQIILLRHANTPERKLHLFKIMLKAIEPLIVICEIDPMALSGGAHWFLLLKALEEHSIEQAKLQECQRIEEAFHKRGLLLNLAEIMHLKGYAPENLLEQSSQVHNPTPQRTQDELLRRVDLLAFCRRVRRGELLPPSLTINELSEAILPQGVVEEVIDDARWAMENCRIAVTPGYLLYRKYYWDPTLVHALFLAQITIEKGLMHIRMGNLLLKAPPLPSRAHEEVSSAANFMKEFLEWCFRLHWLTFTPEQEASLIKFIQGNIRRRKLNKARKLQEKLQENGLPVRLPMVLFWRREVKDMLLMEAARRSLPELDTKLAVTSLPPKAKELWEQEQLSPEMDFRIGRLAFSQGMITEEELQQALMIQVTARSRGERKKLGEVMVERNYLTTEQISSLLLLRNDLLHQSNVSQEGPSEEDMELIRLVQEYKLIPHEDLQRCLSLQLKLQQVGIFQSIGQLLSRYRFISHQMVLDILGEIRRRKQDEKKEVLERLQTRVQVKEIRTLTRQRPVDETTQTPLVPSRVPLRVRRQVSWQRRLITTTLALLFFLGALSLARLNWRRFTKSVRPARPPVVASPPKRPQHPVPALPPPDQHLDKAMQARGLVEYRGLWITPQRRQRLMALKSRLAAFQGEIGLQDIQVDYQRGCLSIQGQLDMPPLLEDQHVYLDLYLLAPFNSEDIYVAKQTVADYRGAFSARLQDLPRPLAVGNYRLQIVLDPQAQHPQVKRLLPLYKPQRWTFPFRLGSPAAIRTALEKDYQQLAAIFAQCTTLFKDLQTQTSCSATALRRRWPQWAPWWRQRKQKLEDILQQRLQQSLIPRFPQTEFRLMVLLRKLDRFYQRMKLWYRGGSLIPPQQCLRDNGFGELLIATRNGFVEEARILRRGFGTTTSPAEQRPGPKKPPATQKQGAGRTPPSLREQNQRKHAAKQARASNGENLEARQEATSPRSTVPASTNRDFDHADHSVDNPDKATRPPKPRTPRASPRNNTGQRSHGVRTPAYYRSSQDVKDVGKE